MGNEDPKNPPSGTPAPTPETPKYVTEEQLSKILAQRLPSLLEPSLKSFGESLMERLKPQAPAPTPPTGKAAEMAELVEKEVAPLKRQLQEERAERRKVEQAKALDEERSELSKALEDGGVSDPELRRAAIAILHVVDKKVQRNKDGRIVWKEQKDGYEDELPLAEGIKAFLSSETGKRYLPPRGAGGSNSTSRRPGPTPDRPLTKEELKRQAANNLARAFGMKVPE